MEDTTNSTDIVETLDAILSHKIFSASPKAQDFLRYVITETIAGRAEKLTGAKIAQDVYGKDSDFDSIQDSVVRVTARRVRYMLQDYYSQCPAETKVKISIPKGKYRPHFEYLENPVEQNSAEISNRAVISETKKNKAFWVLGLLAALLFIAAIGVFLSKMENNSTVGKSEIASYPSVAIVPFTNQTDDDAYSFLEKGLQKQMTEDLSRFVLIRPIAYDGSYESLHADNPPIYDYAITGVMLGVEPEIDVYIKLIDLNKTDVIFEDRVRRAPGQSQYYDALFNMVSELSGNIAGFEGVIVQDSLDSIQDKIAAGTDALSDLTAFECHSLIRTLLSAPSPDLYKTTYNCLETLLEEEPENDTLLAAFGWITYIGATSHESVLMARSIKPDINADHGFEMMEKALKLNPENAWAQQALSAVKFYKGDIQSALKHAELAVIENPANPDNLAWLSICLAHTGKWDRAVDLAQEALDRNPEPDASYYYTLFLKGLNDNDAAAMTSIAKTFTLKESYYAQLYSYLAAIAAEDTELMKKLKPQIDKLANRNGGDIMTVIKSRMPSEGLQRKAERLIIQGELIFADVDG